MKKIAGVIFLLFVCKQTVMAQHDIRFFEGEKNTGKYSLSTQAVAENEFLYFGGQAYLNYDSKANLGGPPAVVKADTSGKVYWTYTPTMEIFADTLYDGLSMRGSAVSKLWVDDQMVYVMVTSYWASDSYFFAIVALNKNTGNMVWRDELPATLSVTCQVRLAGDRLLVRNNEDYWLLNSRTGTVELKKTIPDLDVLEVDADGSVYLGRKDTLEVYSSPTLARQIWAKKVSGEERDRYAIMQIVPNEDGYVYYTGMNSFSFPLVGRIRKSDGIADWLTKPTAGTGNNEPTRLLVKGDYVYTTFGGEGVFYYEAVKLQRTTGATVWNAIDDGMLPREWPPVRTRCSITWGDLDEAGNLYLTGRETVGATSRWLIAKVNPEGKLIYYTVLREEQPIWFEEGLKVHVMKNRVLYMGNIMDTANQHSAVVMTDTSGTFNPVVREINPTFEEPGTVKGLAPYSAGKYAVYGQAGNRAMLQLRNVKDDGVVWTRYVEQTYPPYPERGPEIVYCEADRLCITKDNAIGITVVTYRGGDRMFQHNSRADSLMYMKFDSLGNVLFTNRTYIHTLRGFKSLQLYPANPSYTALVFKGREFLDWDYDSSRYMILNLHKPNERNDDPMPTTGHISKPAYGSTQMLVPYVGDSTLYVYSGLWGENVRQYNVSSRFFTLEPGKWNGNRFGYIDGPSRRINGYDDAELINISSVDSLNILIIGVDKASRKNMVLRYGVKEDAVSWSYVAGNGITLHNASSDGKATYCMGNAGGDLVGIKLNNVTGQLIWEKKVQPPRAGLIYCTIDQHVNERLQEYTICGYLKDTTRILPRQWPFYIVFDAAGNIVQRWEREPYFDGKSQLNTIMVNQFGQTMIAGSFYKKEEGRAGVIITANAPSPVVENIIKYVCETGRVVLAAGISGTSYQWQEDDGLGFRDLRESATMQGVHSAMLKIIDISAGKQKNRYRCVADEKSGPWYTLETAGLPSIKITGDSLVRAAASVTLVASTVYAGDQPSYVWEDSSSLHSWKKIPGAVAGAIAYTPSAMKTKLRCKVTSSLECASGAYALSPVFNLYVDPATAVTPVPVESYGISIYPNPVVADLVIDSLRVSDQWGNLEIQQVSGRPVYNSKIRNQTRIIIPVSHLPAGVYIIVLHGKNSRVARYRFVKL